MQAAIVPARRRERKQPEAVSLRAFDLSAQEISYGRHAAPRSKGRDDDSDSWSHCSFFIDDSGSRLSILNGMVAAGS